MPDDKIIPKIARNFLRCLAYTEPNGGVDLREIMTMEQKKKNRGGTFVANAHCSRARARKRTNHGLTNREQRHGNIEQPA